MAKKRRELNEKYQAMNYSAGMDGQHVRMFRTARGD
jgi:hypothetical protein